MGLKTETQLIDGIKLTVQQLSVRDGLKLGKRLASFLAPAITKLRADKPDAQLDMETLGPVVTTMLGSIDDADLDYLIDSLFKRASAVVTTNGKPVKYDLCDDANIDTVFGGNLRALFGALRFAIGVNFGGFLGVSAPVAQPDEATAAEA